MTEQVQAAPELFRADLPELERVDSLVKVKGTVKFPTDIQMGGMLWGAVLGSKHPHALIKRINTEKAARLPGVKAVVTHQDIPGEKNHGLLKPDQPIFCREKVLYIGDNIAAVAADTREQAEAALELIEVEYEPLPVLTDMEEALKPDAIKVHPQGNICRHTKVTVGNVDADFEHADIVVENTYETGVQLQLPLETEGGLAYQKDGVLYVYTGGQIPYSSQLQLSRTLNIPPDNIRVYHSPTGGAFGSKIDLPISLILGLLTVKTGRPVKMFLTREETTRVSAWRHPMKITMKTAADKDGRLVAHRVRILENTGPYTSFGPTVLDVCMEVAVGPYKWRSVEVEGYSIFTNYGLSGAFRGYGAPQANVGLESQIDIIAERLGIDPLEFRKRNVVKVGETSVWGHKEGGKAGVYETLLEAEKTDLWVNRSRIKQTSRRPWIKIGVGMSAAMKGVGYGATPDTAAAMMSMKSDGAVVAGISPVEIGQGNMTGYAAVASEILRCDMRRIQVSTGNTDVPNGGGSSASKALYVAGSALVNAAESLVAQILTQASKMLNASLEELDHKDLRVFVKDQPSISLSFADVVKTLGGELRVEGQFDVPRVSSAIPGSLQIPHIIHSFATTVAQVEVDTMTGVVKVKRIIFVPEAGRVINRDAFVGQCVGGVVQGMGFGLCEDAVLDKGVLKTNNFTTYIIPAAGDIPRIEVLPVDGYEDTGPLGIKGVSELPVVPIAAAILDAIHDAVGIRMRQVPATPQRVYALLHQST